MREYEVKTTRYFRRVLSHFPCVHRVTPSGVVVPLGTPRTPERGHSPLGTPHTPERCHRYPCSETSGAEGYRVGGTGAGAVCS